MGAQFALAKAGLFVFALGLTAAASPVLAQEVNFCDDRADLESVPEPWSENTRTFGNGKVRAAVINALEPAIAPYFLIVLHPPLDEYGARNCSMIGSADNYGYAALDFGHLHADYDPDVGLTLSLPGRLEKAAVGATRSLDLTVTINQDTGTVIARHVTANE